MNNIQILKEEISYKNTNKVININVFIDLYYTRISKIINDFEYLNNEIYLFIFKVILRLYY